MKIKRDIIISSMPNFKLTILPESWSVTWLSSCSYKCLLQHLHVPPTIADLFLQMLLFLLQLVPLFFPLCLLLSLLLFPPFLLHHSPFLFPQLIFQPWWSQLTPSFEHCHCSLHLWTRERTIVRERRVKTRRVRCLMRNLHDWIRFTRIIYAYNNKKISFWIEKKLIIDC